MNVITKIDLFERSLIDFLREKPRNNTEVYEFCLGQGFCASKANEVLRKLQKTGKIVVSDVNKGTIARKDSFYLNDPVRVTFRTATNAPHKN